ncbi:MAG: putative dual-specificity RNA methyltransferase RlmN [Parcubacteria group bacterium Athens0714_26]|nr:MAG: putative dual-specificity RNA methyltransferase RlmN [Parcubacteria group bacterium Athens1014_26]TSD03627.1 MAG: putative dual-specificity RNA methyltransferase RlmN [Parcubacteria group bacterium Athens0714_26]
MDLIKFQELFKKQAGYRLGQAKKSLYQELIQNWQEAKALPLILKEELNEKCPIDILAETFISKDKNTIKALVTLEDGLKIETVLIRHKDRRNTVCVSSQVGCAMNCSFCATGKLGFKRNLEVWEIIEQVLFFARYLKKIGERVSNVVFMGMGEPFLNYQNVIEAIKILNDEDGFNLGARHFSISTAGIIEGIEKLAKEKLQINLAVSLHAPDDKLRLELMPINKSYPIRKVLNAVDDYIKKTRRRVMFEYLMIKDINDSEKQAKTLAKLMKKYLYFVNLISYNFTGIFEPSSPSRIKRFKEILEQEGVAVTQRHGFGQDIEGACGQLAGK